MVKKSLVRIILCLTVLILVGAAALAVGSKQDFMLSKDGRKITALNPSSHITARDPSSDAKLTTIAGNLSTYPFATYFCCYGNTLAEGPPSFLFTTWVAIPFTPSADATITRVEVPIFTYSQADPNFLVSIDNDANGVPGKAIKTWKATAGYPYGSCCTLDVENDTAGIPVTSGTQYWFAITTSAKHDFFGAWPFNSTDMRAHTVGSYCKGDSTYCGTVNNGKWVTVQELLPAFAVLGH
jgi:hypothetical protein